MILDDIHNADKLKELETRLAVQEQKLSELISLCGESTRTVTLLAEIVREQEGRIRTLESALQARTMPTVCMNLPEGFDFSKHAIKAFPYVNPLDLPNAVTIREPLNEPNL